MLKVYIPTWEDDPHKSANPFVYTLVDDIKAHHDDIEFYFGLDFLWSNNCLDMDCIHVMWPYCFEVAMKMGNRIDKRIKQLKKNNVTIITTCHNLEPHVATSLYTKQAYDIFYSFSDIIIHLGNFSLELFKKKYPNAHHQLIPHHVYDQIYTSRAERSESCKKLNLNPQNKYILCFGAFRNDKEKSLVRALSRKLYLSHIRIIAPSYIYFPSDKKNLKSWRRPLFEYLIAKMSGLIVKGKRVSDAELKYYYGAADICLIQRPNILNSGNLPLGMLMGRVVIGPNVGNVGQILKDTNNPTFDPLNIPSIIESIKHGLILARNNKGEDNYHYCLVNLTTHVVADMHYKTYKKNANKNCICTN